MDNEHEPHRQRKKPKVKESIIDHTYRDYSQVEVSSDEETTGGGDDKKHSRLQPNFPAKLHAIVSNPNYQHIICWQPHGRSWKIVDKHLLSTVVCPKHFAHAKFESFNRSVNGWGFKRLLNPGPDCKSYYHECFLRGRPELSKLMQRLVNPGKRLPDKAGEPDFYEISRKYPLPAAPAGTSQEPDAATSLSPHHTQRASQAGARYPFPHSQTGGYPYGYYPAGPYPQMPSPASGFGQPYPPQPPQQAYWPNQIPPSMYPPNPSAYGYYPYPQMMMPQGYDPQSFPQSSMYNQYYPSTPTAYPNPGSPERLKPTASQAQPQQQQKDDHGQAQGQFFQSHGPHPDRPPANEADTLDERKTPAQTSLIRPLVDARASPGEVYSPRPSAHLESSNPPHSSGRSTQEGGYNPAAYAGGQIGAGNVSGVAVKPARERNNATTAPAPGAPAPAPKEEGGDGINEQQLLQDFFQQF